MANWNLTHWDATNGCLVMKWSELKKSDQKDLSIFADAVGYHICVFHCLASDLLCGGGYNNYIPNMGSELWMFPVLYVTSVGSEGTNSTAASKVKDMLKPYCGVVNSVPQDASAKCLRVGGVNEVVKRCNNLLHGIISGYWEMKSLNTFLFRII